jgi:hypothetical protein
MEDYLLRSKLHIQKWLDDNDATTWEWDVWHQEFQHVSSRLESFRQESEQVVSF